MSLILHYTYENCDNDTTDSFELFNSEKELEDHLSWFFRTRYCFEPVGVYIKDEKLSKRMRDHWLDFSEKEEFAIRVKSLSEDRKYNELLLNQEKENFKNYSHMLNEEGIQHFQNKIREYEKMITHFDKQIQQLKDQQGMK